MGKGKAIVLHLLAIVAGWGMVAALRPVVGSWLGGGGQAAAGESAPAKTPRVRSAAEVAAGQKLLQRLTAARRDDPNASGPFSPFTFAELVIEYRRKANFDPVAPAPPRDDESMSPEETAAATEYHKLLGSLLNGHLDGVAGPDYSHAFRHGRLEAQAIYDSMASHVPGAAAEDTLRIALYRHLAPLDPVRAAALLHPMSEKSATAVKYEAFADLSTAFTPDTALALLSDIPLAKDESGMFQRELVWINGTTNFQHYYGSDYLPWVEQLPAGIDRDLAAVTLLSHLRESDLPGYRRIRTLVTDPRKLAPFPPR